MMDPGIKRIEPDQNAVDKDIDGIDPKDHSLQRDWSDLEERQAKRKFVSPPKTQLCYGTMTFHWWKSRSSRPS
jgi:hypothetical protein